jgi:hypothetical protein
MSTLDFQPEGRPAGGGGGAPLAAATRQLAIVLSGPMGERLPLSGWPQRRTGATFYLVIVAFPGHLGLGPFDLEAAEKSRFATTG